MNQLRKLISAVGKQRGYVVINMVIDRVDR